MKTRLAAQQRGDRRRSSPRRCHDAAAPTNVVPQTFASRRNMSTAQVQYHASNAAFQSSPYVALLGVTTIRGRKDDEDTPDAEYQAAIMLLLAIKHAACAPSVSRMRRQPEKSARRHQAASA